MDILSITNKSSVSSDAKVYTKDGSDFVTTAFDALYKNSSAKTNIEKSVSDANARIDTTNNTVAELDNYARAKGNGIVLHSQGEMVTVNDSSDDYMVNLKPYGKSEQDSTTGAQLFDKSNVTTGYELNSTDGSVSENSAYYVSDFIEVVENESYYLYKHTEDSGISNCFYDENKNFLSTITKNYGELLVPSGAKYLRFNGSIIGIDGVMLNVGSTPLPYEPYTGGTTSPNPDYPQEIRSTVVSEVRSCGKNQLENTATSQTINGVTTTINEDKSVTVNGTSASAIYITLGVTKLTKGEFRATGTPKNGGVSSYRLYFETSSSTSVYYDNGTGVVISIDNEQYVYANLEIKAGTTLNNVTFYPMIRKADITDATYEPYTETVAQLSNPITLNAIPTDSDGNFTDSNGQQWIADYIDVAKGKVVRCVNTEVFDGSENWYITNGDANFFHTIISKKALSNTKILCNIAQFEVIATYTEELGCLIVDSNNLRYRYEVNNNLTVDDVKQHLSQHNMIIYYPLATPTEEDLPTADVVALKNLKTFYSVTNVTNDSEVKGETVLFYNADTKMYIDNKFAELAAQLV